MVARLLALALAIASVSAASAAKAKPNIVLFLCDVSDATHAAASPPGSLALQTAHRLSVRSRTRSARRTKTLRSVAGRQ